MTAMAEERTDGAIIDGNTYDAHYLAGNYYQWNAATAGTGGESVTSGNADDSICPKGWKLPTNGYSTGSFGGLTSAYSLSGSTGAAALTKSPLYFIPAGFVASSGTLSLTGNYGYYWSCTAISDIYAYSLHFHSSRVNPSGYSVDRYLGLPVRCLAR